MALNDNMIPTFLDIQENDRKERARLEQRLFVLNEQRGTLVSEAKQVAKNARAGRHGADVQSQAVYSRRLPPALENERKAIQFLLAPEQGNRSKFLDPLFFAVRDVLSKSNDSVSDIDEPRDGTFPQFNERDELVLAAVYGLVLADRQIPPGLRMDAVRNPDGSPQREKTVVGVTDRLEEAIGRAATEYGKDSNLFDATLAAVSRLGERDGKWLVRASQWASVARALREQGIDPEHGNFELMVQRVLGSQVARDEGAAAASIDIDLPDLEAVRDIEIERNNVLAMQIFYPSWMLEDVKFFDTYDKIEELFLNQLLPIGRGQAGNRIYDRWKKSNTRISKPERLNFYASCFGAPNGNPSVPANREFPDLWLRFVSAVSEFARKNTLEDLLRSRIPMAVSTEQVRKSGRDLAANLSLHGYGIAYFAATELQNEINDIIGILNDPEIRAAYGARDMWQLIEQVSIYELGGARNTVRYRTMATAGAVIIRWLADHGPALAGPSYEAILDIESIRQPSLRPAGVRATQAPTDRDLVDACEQWLAVTGTTDDRIEEFSQATEAPLMTSRPVQIPQVAREMLESVGVAAGYGGGGNGGRYPGQRR